MVGYVGHTEWGMSGIRKYLRFQASISVGPQQMQGVNGEGEKKKESWMEQRETEW